MQFRYLDLSSHLEVHAATSSCFTCACGVLDLLEVSLAGKFCKSVWLCCDLCGSAPAIVINTHLFGAGIMKMKSFFADRSYVDQHALSHQALSLSRSALQIFTHQE